MSFDFIRKLPIPKDIKEQYPLSPKVLKIQEERGKQIRDIFTGKDPRFVLIIGPCSADSEEPVMDYTLRLAALQSEIEDKILIIPRIYTNKPRTTGQGYKGMIHQPDPTKKPDMLEGLIAIRKLHIDAVEQTGLLCADEMLYPENYRYLSDILGYVAVGARSVEDQQHRLTVSGMDIPAGMKNPTSGDFSVMLNSIVAAQSSHTFLYRGWEVTSTGNPLSHAILRGAVNKHGQCVPNYHYEDLTRLQKMYTAMELNNPTVIIDANHSNSNKKYLEQIRICEEVLHSRNYDPSLKPFIKGFMIESYLEDGNQKIGEGVYGKSITDPCLGWDKTKALIENIYRSL